MFYATVILIVIGPVVLMQKDFSKGFRYVAIIFPQNGCGFLNNLNKPLTQRCYEASLVEISPMVLEKKMKI